VDPVPDPLLLRKSGSTRNSSSNSTVNYQEYQPSKNGLYVSSSINIRWKFIASFPVFAAVTVKNSVVWDIKPQFVLHRRHITSPLQSPAS
jgi:hypothetical protein